jgi:YesN/AraC family two-component response regulator
LKCKKPSKKKGVQMETVLIVDDNAIVGKMVRAFIEASHPSTVIVHAKHGAHAWEIISVHGKKFDLVISDVEMPVMGGVELVKKIREGHPDTHVILISGEEEPKNHKAHAFLGKPIERADLLRTIQRLMDKS